MPTNDKLRPYNLASKPFVTLFDTQPKGLRVHVLHQHLLVHSPQNKMLLANSRYEVCSGRNTTTGRRIPQLPNHRLRSLGIKMTLLVHLWCKSCLNEITTRSIAGQLCLP